MFQPSLRPSVSIGAVLPECLFQSQQLQGRHGSCRCPWDPFLSPSVCRQHLAEQCCHGVKLLSESLLDWFLSVVAMLLHPTAALWPKWSQGTVVVAVDVPAGDNCCWLWLPWAARGGGLYGARQKCWLWCNSRCCHGTVTRLIALLSL